MAGRRLSASSWLIVGLLAAVGSVVTGALLWPAPRPAAAGCSGRPVLHRVIIEHDQVRPAHTTANRCDRLTITNRDAAARLIAFGQHDHHQAYDGVSEQLLGRGQSLTLTLAQAGDYLFHDHDQDEVQGTFTVR